MVVLEAVEDAAVGSVTEAPLTMDTSATSAPQTQTTYVGAGWLKAL